MKSIAPYNLAMLRYFRAIFFLCLFGLACGWTPFALTDGERSLTLQMIDSRLENLQKSGSGSESDLYNSYSEARELLVQANVFALEAEQFTNALRNAPVQQAETQSRIDDMEATPALQPDVAAFEASELRTRLQLLRLEREKISDELATTERYLAARETSSLAIQTRLTSVKAEIEALPEDLPLAPLKDQASESEAIIWKNSAQRTRLHAERQALEAEANSQPVRYALLTVQRNEQQLQLDRMSESVLFLEEELTNWTVDAIDIEKTGIQPSTPVYPIAEQLIQLDSELREERLATSNEVIPTRAATEAIKVKIGTLRDRYAIARRMVDFASDSDSLGKLLLRHWQELTDEDDQDRFINISRETSKTVIRRIELEDILRQRPSTLATLQSLLAQYNIDQNRVDPATQDALSELISAYRQRLNATIETQSEYLETLRLLTDASIELEQLSKEYSDYLGARILWIPNFTPLWSADFSTIGSETRSVWQDLRGIRLAPGLLAISALLLCVMATWRRHQLMATREILDQKIVKPRDDSVVHTLYALFCDLVLALPLPALLACIGYSIEGNTQIGGYILQAAAAYLVLIFGRRICKPDGIGARHFGWPEPLTERLYRDSGWLMGFWLPLLSIIGWLVQITPTAGDGILSRSVIVVLLLPSLLVLIFRMLTGAKATEAHWLSTRLQKMRLLAALLLLVTASAVVVGHVYSVILVFQCLLKTLLAGLAVTLVYALLMRWIQVTRRRLRLAELLAANSGNEPQEEPQISEETASLVDVSEDTQGLVNASIVAVAIALALYIWSPLFPLMGILSEIPLWTTTSQIDGELVENTISLASLLIIIALATLTIYAARKLPAVIDLLLRSQTEVSSSTRYTISTLLNYVIIGVGALSAFGAMGLQWAQMQWLVAALGVGIGFGLQEIIANFISGLIILFERPIRVGDVVSTGDKDGIVARIRIRATTIIDWDGRELLVPNKEFITGRVLNWSLSDSKIRLVLPIGVAYGCDVEKALRILDEIVTNHPRVIADPAPSIIFDAFGDNSLSLIARCFLDSMDNRVGVMTELNREIYRRFAEADIVIAFPQRDIHFDTDKPLRVSVEAAPGESRHSPTDPSLP